MMLKAQHNELKLFSLLLLYPDDSLLAGISELQSAVENLPRGDLQRGFKEFLSYLTAENEMRLRERYTAVFDMNPSTSLNLTYHLWGDGEQRAAAMTRLKQVYLDAGFEPATGDLPDYLPLMLEFLAVCPQSPGIGLIWKSFRALETLVERLRETAPSYSDLLRLLGECCRCPISGNGSQFGVSDSPELMPLPAEIGLRTFDV